MKCTVKVVIAMDFDTWLRVVDRAKANGVEADAMMLAAISTGIDVPLAKLAIGEGPTAEVDIGGKAHRTKGKP